MAIHHAKPAEVFDVRPLGDSMRESKSTVLVKTDTLELIRIVLPAGKQLPPHRVEGEITVQCLEGRLVLTPKGPNMSLRRARCCISRAAPCIPCEASTILPC
jgi:quercetin dioxygenase-like cupin family protein